jgi:nucleoside-diphosphate-sugar epimerase
VAKDALRRILERYCDDTRLSWAWGRVFTPFGPGEPAEKLVTSIITAVLAGRPAVCSAGTQERDYLYVNDIADAFATITLGEVVGCVNVASGVAVTVGRVATLVGEQAGRPDLIRLGERSAAATDAPRVVADVRRLTDEVGWRPAYTLESGLAETLRAARGKQAGTNA